MVEHTIVDSIEQRLNSLPKDRISTMRIIGFTFFCIWILGVFYSTFLYLSSPDFREALYLNLFVSLSVLTLTLAAVPKFVKHADKWVLSKRVVYTATAFLTMATAILCFTDSKTVLGFWLIVTSGVLTGISSGLMFLGWVRIFSDAGTRTAMVETSLSWTLAALSCVVLFFLPAVASTVLALVMTVASGMLLRRCALRRPKRPLPFREHTLHKRTRKMFARGLVAAVSFGVIAGFSDVLSGFRFLPISDSYGVFLMLGSTVLSCAALTIAVFSKHQAVIYTYRLAFMSMAFGCITIPFIAQTASISNVAIFGGYTCFTIVLTAVCIDISNYFDVRATKAIGYAFFALYLGEVIGSGAAHILTAFYPGQNALTFVTFFLTGAALFANLFLFTEKDLIETSIGEMTDGDTGESAQSAGSDSQQMEAVIAQLIQQYNLSKREADVLPLIVRGRTLARIQEELFISQGTVSTHTRHIYQKIGVKNRQALLDLIDRMTIDGDSQ